MTVTTYIRKGNSCPVILENEGRTYFVKLHAGMSGKYALLSEWIGNQLGNQIGIPTQIPHWIELGSDLKIDDIYIEVRDLIGKSLGTNIGFAYLKDTKDVHKDDLKDISTQLKNEIFLFDLMMLNIDRTADNLNLMRVEDKIFSVDYESSLLLPELIEGKNFLEDERILKCFRQSPLYGEMSEDVIDRFLEKVENLSIEKTISEIPIALLSEEERLLILNGVEEKKRNKWFLQEVMRKLKNIKVETKKEHKRRINENQAKFKRRFGENLK